VFIEAPLVRFSAFMDIAMESIDSRGYVNQISDGFVISEISNQGDLDCAPGVSIAMDCSFVKK
jgi:hypothetical protein